MCIKWLISGYCATARLPCKPYWYQYSAGTSDNLVSIVSAYIAMQLAIYLTVDDWLANIANLLKLLD